MTRFGARLAGEVAAHGPLCAGIDPHAGLLAAWGLADDAAGVERFGRTVVEALAGHVACVKPQAAFFERHGSRGVAALERVIADARDAGLLTVVDAKRGDIGSTMGGYADAFVGDSPLAGDAVTVSPYLGFGSLRPVLDLAAAHGRGVFVLALTSNPEGASVQHAVGPDGRAVARAVAEAAAAENAGATPFGDVGLVVGATVGAAVTDLGLDLEAVNGPLLAPGVGAQGATAADLQQVFGRARRLVLASSSREVLAAGPTATGLRDAAHRTADAVRAALAL
ncbi:orotidine-5'-phosphate decarboxylase [Kineococcus aurantiacus]|uniref:Orotidine 5'-phosphate decarboxylase n=1 Tax=Kineococcus aurantiacus TaxID=37633 RepID=A0A7Y9AS45_9ACTN|nr:orotidine-5'-phosphate decarboxylase [Kineococcus aurantiacus]NYD20797.1 orotidine-5'-phosphate decarboxylase [Kineococcus aurantiacus]